MGGNIKVRVNKQGSLGGHFPKLLERTLNILPAQYSFPLLMVVAPPLGIHLPHFQSGLKRVACDPHLYL